MKTMAQPQIIKMGGDIWDKYRREAKKGDPRQEKREISPTKGNIREVDGKLKEKQSKASIPAWGKPPPSDMEIKTRGKVSRQQKRLPGSRERAYWKSRSKKL